MTRKARILIVDNDDRLRRALKRRLAKENYGLTVFTASNAQEALDLADREWLHCALIDVILTDDPDDRGGFDLALKMWRGIFKIFLTVLADGTSSRSGLSNEMKEEANVVGYIPKGDGEQKILELVAKVVSKLNLDLSIHWREYSSLMAVEMLKSFRGKDDNEKKSLAEELEDLICRAFDKAKSIAVTDLKRGKGGCAVARLLPTLSDGKGAELVMKFGPRQTIMEEFENYTLWVKDYVPFESAVVRDIPVETLHLAAIKYSFLGGSGIMGSFKDFFASAPPNEIEELLSHLFEVTCEKWYEARRAPKDEENIPLDQLYRSAKSLNLADMRHVTELVTRVSELLKPGHYAANLRADGSYHIQVDLGSFSERLPNPLEIALRERWSNGSQRSLFRPSSLMAITHGDLNGENILVSQAKKGFLIDFYKTGFSPIFRDFVVLESIMKFELLRKANLAQRYQLERDLLAPTSLSEPITLCRDLEQDSEMQKVAHAVGHLRRLAAQASLSNDIYEYYVGLLFYALKEIVGFSSGDEESNSGEVRQFHAFLSAAKICEKLLNSQTAEKDKTTASVFLNYAREDLKLVADIYQRLKLEGLSPWMDTEDIIGGENWRHSIRRALKHAHLIIPVLTKNAVHKRSFRQTEIKWALDLSLERMTSDIHIIPVRLEPDCEIPEELEHLQYIDLFEPQGWHRLIQAIREGIARLERP